MEANIWKNPEVAAAFLDERSRFIPDRQRQLEVLLWVIRCTCPEPTHILDLGCGDGILLATLLGAFPQANGIAVDFSPLMLEKAHKRLATFGPRATTLEADLQTSAWTSQVHDLFDVVVSGFAIHHLTDERKRTIYREIYDLLTNGGVFINSEHVSSRTPRVERMSNDAMSEHLYLPEGQRRERDTGAGLSGVSGKPRPCCQHPCIRGRAVPVVAGNRSSGCRLLLEILRVGHLRWCQTKAWVNGSS